MTALVYLSIVAFWTAGLLRLHPPAEVPCDAAREPVSARAVPAAAALAALFLGQLAIVAVAAQTQRPFPAWFARMPLLPIDDRAPLYWHTPGWVGTSLLCIALAQAALLLALHRMCRGRTLTRRTRLGFAACCAAMLAGALGARGLTSFDLYAYVASAQLGAAAYQPPAHLAFSAQFGVLNAIYGAQMLPAAYGPLWLALSRTLVAPWHSLYAQLEALRVVAALLFGVCILLLRAARVPAATIVLFALNPALVDQFVANGHNDLAPLTLTLAAFAAARRRPLVAVAFAAAAGAMKAPFAIVGMLAFAALRDVRHRIGYAVAALGGSLALAALFGGHPYLLALQRTAAYYPLNAHLEIRVLYAAAIGAALGATVLALARRLYNPTAAWAFASFGVALFPWYVVWGLPYALAEGSSAFIFLASLPVAVMLPTTVFSPTLFSAAIAIAILCVPGLLVVKRMRANRSTRALTAQLRT